MMTPGEPTSGRAGRCAECHERLAQDQRYCLRCGARRGPLPARIAVTIGEIYERGRPLPSSGAELAEGGGPAGGQHTGAETGTTGSEGLIGAARAAAVALLVMLGFGCVIGAATAPGGVESLAKTIIVAVSPPSRPAATTVASHQGSSGARSGGSSGNHGSSAPAAAPAAADPPAQTARTVTLPAPASSPGGGGGGGGSGPPSSSSLLLLPPIKHVFEIVLSDQGYQQSFGTTQGHPYLSRTLTSQGELITNYDAVAPSPLANEVALISGQGPTEQTVANCPTFGDITPAAAGKNGQVLGDGCVYPSATETLGDQLSIAGLKWRAYIQGIGATETAGETTTTTGTTSTPTTPTATAPPTATTPITPTTPTSPAPARTCPHPTVGEADPYRTATSTDDYVTWTNPFVYFHSLLDSPLCARNDVGLDRLATDLGQASTTPAFSYIAPNPCDNGSDQPCAPGAPAGLARADTFLKQVVPEIERSAAYKQGGMIVITFDEAPQSGSDWDTSSCCDQPTFPNLKGAGTTTTTASTTPGTTTTTTTGVTTAPTACPTTTVTTTTPTTTTPTTTTASPCGPAITGTPPGGGQVGLLLISRYVKPGTTDSVDAFNHFSLLKSIENLFGLSPLGYAHDNALPVFDAAIFTNNKK
jgi:hypothetical protein